MNNKISKRNNQQGIALISAVLIVMIFAIMGMMNAQKAKESERMSGAVVRYETVFEAAEQSLRDAGNYLLNINGTPYVGTGSKGRDKAANFDTSDIDNVKLVMSPSSAIVWNRVTLADTACGSGSCKAGIDFVTKLDKKELWVDLAIKSNFGDSCTGSTAGTDEVACNNYLRDIETYTIIEKLRSNDGSGGQHAGTSAMQGSSGLTGTGYETYYLITVKASGYPPGTADKDSPYNARENTVLQGVFARL